MSFLLPIRKGPSPNARSFKTPPLDGSLVPAQLYDWHYEHNPTQPVIVYSGEGKVTEESIHIRYSDFVPAAHRAGRFVAKAASIDIEADPHTYPVVAILAWSDTITYHTTLVGMMRAGIPVATISPRLAPSVIAHLLRETNATHVMISSQPELRSQAEAAVTEVLKTSGTKVGISRMPIYDVLYGEKYAFERLPDRQWDYDATTIIAPPLCQNRFDGMRDEIYKLPSALCSEIKISATPSGAVTRWNCSTDWGYVGYYGMKLSTGFVMAMFPPSEPAIQPTIKNIIDGYKKTKPDWGLLAPRYIQDIALDLEQIKALSGMKGISYAGVHLNKAVGDYLVQNGVKIFTIYGSSEGGCIGKIFPENLGLDWEYIGLNPHASLKLVPLGDGTSELFVVGKHHHELAIINVSIDGYDTYATKDLFFPHPTRPGLWKILGRSDDQIMLTTGETIAPNALEDIVCQHAAVAAAVMFGRNKPWAGIIIQPKPEFVFDIGNEKSLEDFKKNMWEKIAEMNAFAPPHARVTKNMLVIASPSKPFVYTGKGVPRRPVVLSDYLPEIESAYRTETVIRTD